MVAIDAKAAEMIYSLTPGEAAAESELTRDPKPQELAVMQMVASGHKDRAIARRLGVSVVTVRRWASSFRRRMGAKSRTQAVALGVQRGWIRVAETDLDSNQDIS